MSTSQITGERLCYDERFTSKYLGVSLGTIRRWRHEGRGPRFRKLGGLVRYTVDDLLAWLNSQPVGGQVPDLARETK